MDNFHRAADCVWACSGFPRFLEQTEGICFFFSAFQNCNRWILLGVPKKINKTFCCNFSVVTVSFIKKKNEYLLFQKTLFSWARSVVSFLVFYFLCSFKLISPSPGWKKVLIQRTISFLTVSSYKKYFIFYNKTYIFNIRHTYLILILTI